jgi:signal transduction histidine kinase
VRRLLGLGEETLVTQLVLAVVGIGLVAAALGTFLVTATGRAALRAEVGDQHVSIAEELAGRLDAAVASSVEMLRVVGANGHLLEGAEDASAALRATLREVPRFDALTLYDRSGEPVAAAATDHLTELDRVPTRTDLADVPAAGTVHRLIPGAVPHVEIAVPVEDPPGTPVAVLVGELPVDVLMQPAQRVDTRSRTVRFLVDGDGTVIAHPERNRVVTRERLPLDFAGAEGGWRDAIEQGDDRALVGVAPLSTLDLSVVVEQAEAEAYGDVDRQVAVFISILVLVLAAVVVVGSVVGRRILRPVGPLVDAVERIGRGERDVHIDPRGGGELRRLSEQVRELARTLDRRTSALEELQQLSLLVNARLQRDDVTEDVVEGALTLLRGDTAAIWLADPTADGMLLAASRPPGADVATTEAPADDARTGGEVRRSNDDRVHVIAIPVTDGEGMALGALVVCREDEEPTDEEVALTRVFAAFSGVALENVRRLELERSLVSELQETMDRKQHLIGSISHEFRTPLACVVGFAEALDEGWEDYDEDERRDFVTRIATHAEEIDELVRQLLDFAVVERTGGDADLRALDLGELVRTAVAGLEPLIAERPLSIEVPHLRIIGDAALVRRVLTNLLSNAVKYSPEGSPIVVGARVDGTAARIEVTDRGVGLEPHEAEQVFEPFWRAANGRAPGVGLGLSLVAQYVRAMGGQVEVDSTPGEGSTFAFTVPLADEHLPAYSTR